MPSKKPQFVIRTEQEVIDKIQYIAKEHERSGTQEIVYLLKQYIRNYEMEHGVIDIKDINMQYEEQESSTAQTQINNINAIAVQQKNVIKK